MLRVEETEVKTWDKSDGVIVDCSIKNGVFSCVRNETTVFNSEIYKYDDVNIVVNREPRFGEYYYNIALYNQKEDKAWPLISLPTRFQNNLKRLGEKHFIIWNDSPGSVADVKQCTFCTIHDNEKQDHITIDFHILHGIHFLPNNHVLISFSQVFGGGSVEQSVITSLSLYGPSGKLIKTLYEFNVKDEVTFEYEVDLEQLTLTIKGMSKGEEQDKMVIKFTSLFTDAN